MRKGNGDGTRGSLQRTPAAQTGALAGAALPVCRGDPVGVAVAVPGGSRCIAKEQVEEAFEGVGMQAVVLESVE